MALARHRTDRGRHLGGGRQLQIRGHPSHERDRGEIVSFGGLSRIELMHANQNASIEPGSPDRFGYEWSHYSEMRPEYEEQFRRWTAHLSTADWRGKTFLDVGCGMGRNSYWPLTYGAEGGVAIDVDQNSLAAARRTLSTFPNASVGEMSAYEIGYEERFDIAFSIGVIHHLEHPGLALRQMARSVKPGGAVLIWVYGHENNEWLVKVLDPLRRTLFSRLPIRVVHHLSLYPTIAVAAALRFRSEE